MPLSRQLVRNLDDVTPPVDTIARGFRRRIVLVGQEGRSYEQRLQGYPGKNRSATGHARNCQPIGWTAGIDRSTHVHLNLDGLKFQSTECALEGAASVGMINHFLRGGT